MSQSAQILGYLQRGNSINPGVALRLFGSFRLAARIKDLRNEGHPIQRDWLETREGKRVAVYFLGKKKAPTGN